MLISQTGTPSNLNTHPLFSSSDSTREKADKVKKLLLELSKETGEKELSSAFRKTADFFRETFYGHSERQIVSKITAALEEYFDGEIYVPVELPNLLELTGLKEEVLTPALEKMVKKGLVLQGRRRRHNELGEHYNPIYKLRK